MKSIQTGRSTQIDQKPMTVCQDHVYQICHLKTHFELFRYMQNLSPFMHRKVLCFQKNQINNKGHNIFKNTVFIKEKILVRHSLINHT